MLGSRCVYMYIHCARCDLRLWCVWLDFQTELLYKKSPKLLNQFQYCERETVPFIVIVGEEEKAKGGVKIRDVRTRQEVSTSPTSQHSANIVVHMYHLLQCVCWVSLLVCHCVGSCDHWECVMLLYGYLGIRQIWGSYFWAKEKVGRERVCSPALVVNQATWCTKLPTCLLLLST